MSLIMSGQIDAVFRSVPVTLYKESGGDYVEGIWQDGTYSATPYVATIQPLTDQELDFLFRGGERIVDPRKIYINDGDLSQLLLGNYFSFSGQLWKIIKRDVREWRRYSRIIVSRIDEQPPEDLDEEEKETRIVVDKLYELVNEEFSKRL